MVSFKSENMSSESFYPDSTYYLDKDDTSEKRSLPEDQKSNTSNLNGQIAIGLLQKEQMEDLNDRLCGCNY